MPYSSAQNRAIVDFRAITNSDAKTAAKWLKSSGWDPTAAVNTFFSSSTSTHSGAALKNALEALFDKYYNPNSGTPDQLGIDEIMPYFQAVGVDPSNLTSLVVHEIIQAPEMGVVTREGFVVGWTALGCDTLDKQKNLIASRTRALGQPAQREQLKIVYKFAFELCITQQGVRLVGKDELTELWRVLFSPPGLSWHTKNNSWLELWLEFVGANSAKAFNRDVWSQTLRFAEESLKDESLSWWSEEASWPAIIDEFVEWIRDRRGENETTVDDDMEY